MTNSDFFTYIGYRERGFTLIELMIALVVAMIAATSYLTYEMRGWEQDDARRLGAQIGQVSNAIQSYLVVNNSSIRNGLDPNVVLNTPVSGFAWLKHTSCGGGAGAHYIPCQFPDQLFLGVTSETVVTLEAGGTLAATTTYADVTKGGDVRPDLAGIALTVAAGKVATDAGHQTAFTDYSQSVIDGTNAQIVAVAGSNTGLDTWLRIDGGNQMRGNLRFEAAADGSPLYTIENVAALLNVKSMEISSIKPDGVSSAEVEQGIYRVKEVTGVAPDNFVAYPDCNTSQTGLYPWIYLTSNYMADDATGNALAAFTMIPFKNDPSGGWDIEIKVLSADGWKTPGAGYGRGLALVQCLPAQQTSVASR